MIANISSGVVSARTKESLQERQQELKILELCDNGERRYLHFTSRQLFDHVVASVSANNNKKLDATAPPRFHLRDMRSLLRPYSAMYHSATFIVRRHVMVLNFDPLRAIILRDRMLMLVPPNATTATTTDVVVVTRSETDFSSWMNTCERRLKAGRSGMEKDVFGDTSTRPHLVISRATPGGEGSGPQPSEQQQLDKQEDPTDNTAQQHQHPQLSALSKEFEDIEKRNFMNNEPFELQAVDVFLGTFESMLSKNVAMLINDAKEVVSVLGSRHRKNEVSSYTFEALAVLKNESKEMEAALTGFIRALLEMLGNDENLALMNLSKLVSHPQRFAPPISSQILDEESDKPELILESYVEQGHSLMSSLRLLNERMKSTSMHVQFKMDRLQNKLLFSTTLLNGFNVVLMLGIVIFGFFGMNTSVPESTHGLIYIIYHDQPLPYNTDAFIRAIFGTLTVMLGLCAFLYYLLYSPWLSGFNI